MHLSRADRNAAAALLGSPSDPSFYARPEAGEEDAEGSLSPVAESNVEGLPNSQLSDFADALEEVGVRAVSTEWHVHLVREAESQQQFRRDSPPAVAAARLLARRHFLSYAAYAVRTARDHHRT